MRTVGLVSGTSHDAIEAAAVDFSIGGEVVYADVLATRSVPYDRELRSRLHAALPPAPTTLEEICMLDTLIGQAFADAAAALVDSLADGEVDLVCSHGQTVYHWVDGARALGTLQLGQPAWIAERVGAPVVSDFRARDVAAGGHGAPLASILDVLLLAGADRRRAALNLGGIANITVIAPDAEPIAYDTGPASALLDAAIFERTGGAETFDRDGRRSLRGTVDPELLEALLAEPYYALPPPKSTGKELFHSGYLQAKLAGRELERDDLLATLAALTVETVACALERHDVGQVFAAGGGTRNEAIMGGLRARLPDVEWVPFEELGIAAEAKEAVLFALIGFLTASGLAGALPSCTGAGRAAILGSITPGRDPLVLPAPAGRLPTRLVLRAGSAAAGA